MSLDYSQEVIGDLEKVLETNDGYDVIIYAGENENVKELRAHSSILCIRSKYFCTAFSRVWANKKDGNFIFEKPNISPQIFKIILRFIYCGKIDLTKLLGPEILELLMALDELNFHSLISHVQEYLINNQDKFLQQNPIEILEAVYQHESFTDLWNYCLEKICAEPEMLFNSDNFINLKAPLLKLILKRDDLVLDEIEIWNNLLKWGIAKNPSISQDITKWSNEDITIIERSLHGFIPLIRFYHISSDDFFDKIYPLKELLPKDLFDELVKFNIAPNRKPNIDEIQPPRKPKFIHDSTIYDSIIVKCQHFAVFSKKIVGGYNPLFWNSSNQNSSTNDSYIYLFTDGKDTKSAKVSYSNGDNYSIRNLAVYGPAFGGGDLIAYLDGNNWYRCSTNSYPKIDGIPTGYFKVDDYEVFQVIKK
ncbi:BTB/POZ domain-containing protein [Rhizophagus irregularis DAOM 181602=DAOM 197198]|nr:BTB/POZ domain-containing protein [Rhizophagus irregularis DAOM 181602=DAOM 197198]